MGVSALLGALPVEVPVEVPVEPEADEARQWLEQELTQTKYQESTAAPADTSWIDELLNAIEDFLGSLGGEQSTPVWIGIVVLVVIALLVVAFLVFGVPRLRARSAVQDDELFEADDRRDAAAMRRDADAAARAGDWQLAIAERFRAVARRLHERALVATLPGSTAHDVARRAGRALPEHATALESAAHEFDAVRYLGDAGDRERYERLVQLDTALERTRPEIADADDQVDRGELVPR